MIADIELGLIVIEVKSITIDQIVAINGHRWELRNFYTSSSNPYEQAESQLFGLLGYCDREPSLRSKVSGRAIVALPFINQQQWQKKEFDKLPSCPPIIFQEHLVLETPNFSFFQKIYQTYPIIKGGKLNDEQWNLLLAVLGGNPVFRKPKANLTPSVPLFVPPEVPPQAEGRQGETFLREGEVSFTFNHRPKREISVTDAGELLRQYATGRRNFQGAYLQGIQLAEVDLGNANLIGTKLNGADLINAQLDGVKLVIADLSNADLSNASLRKAKLMGAILRDANLSGADLSRADLSDADLRNAKLVGAKLVGANLSAADLSGADLTGANLEAAELSDVNLTGATMPDGSVR